MKRAVLTIATGKPAFVRMAINLARSFAWWHHDSDICFALATDQPRLIPADLRGIQVIELIPGQFGVGFSTKLHLDEIAPAEATLFIDADCLCVGRLEQVFDRFKGRAVSVVGMMGSGSISSGEWFGDTANVCNTFSLSEMPFFNGGVYYLERGELSRQVYTTARELEPRYDALGLRRMRSQPNEELLMAIAMALHGQTAISDDGSILSDPVVCPAHLSLDVLRGGATLRNPPPPDPRHVKLYHLTEVHPVLVHFLGGFTTGHPYRREELRLELAAARGWPLWAADVIAVMGRSIPMCAIRKAKDAFRPAYRRLIGCRKVSSDRL